MLVLRIPCVTAPHGDADEGLLRQVPADEGNGDRRRSAVGILRRLRSTLCAGRIPSRFWYSPLVKCIPQSEH